MDSHNEQPHLWDSDERITLNLSNEVVRSFRTGKIFPKDKISSMDFAPNGQHLIVGRDSQIIVYDCDKGTERYRIETRKYGTDLIRFVGGNENAIHTSTRVDNSIRHLNLLVNEKVHYTRYFYGHKDKVTSLCVSPDAKTFISVSLDKTLRLWDIRSSTCRSILPLSGPPVAAYDPEGLIFAVGIESKMIKLYDMRSYQKGPFSTFNLNQERINLQWTDLKFSKIGKMILVNTDGAITRLVDAFDGKLLQTFIGPSNTKKRPTEASFSSDSQYVFAGGCNGRINVWSVESGNKVCEMDSAEKLGPINCVQCNPKYMMLASASSKLVFWIPS